MCFGPKLKIFILIKELEELTMNKPLTCCDDKVEILIDGRRVCLIACDKKRDTIKPLLDKKIN